MAAREQASLTDWVVIAITPALIMLMLGSLVYFLVEVLYRGQYQDRVLYILFWFVFAAVLIARISIEQGYSKAGLYGLGLGIATLIALNAFVVYPNKTAQTFALLINIVLMAIVWWSANKLTWDCTHIDEGRKASGRGVLAAAGLDTTDESNSTPETEEGDTDSTDSSEKVATKARKKKTKAEPAVLGWWERYQKHRERQLQKPHTPGVWVIYFSLAALPLFGLGQSLIPSEDEVRRRSTFQLMAVYVGSGLGLLVTTSLLGLRKYLRDRGASAPTSMTVAWLGLGVGLIVLFLAVGAILPRPHSETPLFQISPGEKKDRNASKYAVVKDEAAGKGEGATGKKTEGNKEGKASGKSEQKGGSSGEKGSGNNKGNDQGGQKRSEKGSEGNKSSDQGGQKSGDSRSNPEKSEGKDNSNRSDSKASEQQGKKANDAANNTKQDEQGRDSSDPQSRDADQKSEDGSSSNLSSQRPELGKMLENVASFVKWIVWIVIALLVVAGVIVFFLKFLAPFTEWAKNLLDWLKGLFAPKPRGPHAIEDEEEESLQRLERPPPFSSFSNPFDDGSARTMSIPSLVEYSFEALDAWAWDHDLGRKPEETPNEFAARIGQVARDLDKPGRTLASMYVWVLYSKSELPANAKQLVHDFWLAIDQTEIVNT